MVPSAASPRPAHELFILHAEADRAWVEGYLRPELGLPDGCIVTRDEMALAAPQIAEIERLILASRFVLLVVSPGSDGDRLAGFAEQLAGFLAAQSGTGRVLILQRARFRDLAAPETADAPELPPRLAMLGRIDCAGEDVKGWARGVARLRSALALPDAAPAPAPACPYPGMVPFAAEQARLFCGREDEINQLLHRLRHHKLVLLVGPSGSGKTSLLRAGVLPRLAALRPGSATTPGSTEDTEVRICPVELRAPDERADDPAAALEQALGLAPEDGADALGRLAPGARRLVVIDALELAFAAFSRTDPGDPSVVLVPAARQRRFFELLCGLRDAPGFTVLLALRADYFDALINSPLWPIGIEERVELALPRERALREAIVEPAVRAGLHVEPALVERLLTETDPRQLGALPLLQETLLQRFEHRAARLLRLPQPDEEGASDPEHPGAVLPRALRILADAALAQLKQRASQAGFTAAQAERCARRVLLRLVQYGDSEGERVAHTRRRRRRAELAATGEPPALFDLVLDVLTARRILVGSDASPSVTHLERVPQALPCYELSHDALLTAWPLLAAWLTTWQEHERIRRRLEERADAWERSGRRGGLLDAADLAEAARWLDGADADASACLLALVRASRRRLRQQRAGYTCAIVLLGSLLAAALWQRHVAQRRLAQAVDVANAIVFTIDRELDHRAGVADVRRQLLELARALLDALRREAPDHDGALRAQMAQLHQRADLLMKNAEAGKTQLAEAARLYGEAHELAKQQVRRQPHDPSLQSDLSISFQRLGDVAKALGQLDQARSWFEQALAVAKTLAAQDPHNSDWQRDLSISFERLGDVAQALGQLDQARFWFEQALAVAKTLAAQDPHNSDWQRDLSVSFNNLGDVAKALGQLDQARSWFEQDLAVAKTLAEQDPHNSDWQRDLSISFERLGDVAREQHNWALAATYAQQSFEIFEQLARVNPTNAEWQKSLLISLFRMLLAASERNDVAALLKYYDQMRSILARFDRERLLLDEPQVAQMRRLVAQLAPQMDALARKRVGARPEAAPNSKARSKATASVARR